MMKKIIIIAALLCLACSFAQQNVQYTQYMYNTMSFNPGYTGTKGVPTILGLYRSQWVGIEGAPKNIVLSGQTPIKDNRHGIGFTIENDKIGPSSDTRLAFSYAHPVKLSDEIVMSLGVNACGNFMDVDYNKLQIIDQADKELTGKLSRFSPNIGAGAYFYSKKWFAGFSVPDFLETKFYSDIQSSVAKKKMHYYLTGGCLFDLNDKVQFKPGGLVKIVQGAPLGIDVSATFFIYDKFQMGASYRWGGELSFLTGFKIGEDLTIGYAYDYNGGSIGKYTSGTHEAFLQFDILKKHSKEEQITKVDFNAEAKLQQVNDFGGLQDLDSKNLPAKTNPISKTEKKQLKKTKRLEKERAKREKAIGKAKEKALKKEARKLEKAQKTKKKASETDVVSKTEKEQLKKAKRLEKERAKREKAIGKAKEKALKKEARKLEKAQKTKKKASETDVVSKTEKEQLKKAKRLEKERAKREKAIGKAKEKALKKESRKLEKAQKTKKEASEANVVSKTEKEQLKKAKRLEKERAKREKAIGKAKEKALKKEARQREKTQKK